jgi:protein-S-isoprenylcysteine O-methyltransferase Ste14
MSERDLFQGMLLAWIGLAPVIALVLLKIAAPYGRHGKGKVGPRIPARLGWFLMELPALVVFPGLAATRGDPGSPVLILLLAMWVLHYGNRAVVYPWRLRAGSPMPVVILLSGMTFNVINGTFLGLGLSLFDSPRGLEWFADPRPWLGLVLFLGGFAMNLHADAILRGLRKAGQGGYSIPRAGFYRFVSCPNYLGEIVEWTGWAIVAWSLPGLAFAIWTVANLLPRALTHHQWYRRTFPDYPGRRKAILPFLL